MKRKNLKLIVGTLFITCIAGVITACGSENTVAGDVTISGSSALLPLVESSVEGFNEKYSNININAQAGGSGTGLTQVSDGTVDIGNSDIFAEEKLGKDKVAELKDHEVVAQGFAVVVNKELGIDNLTKQQIKDIFSGKITNWKQVGGIDKDIFVIHRPSSSGTRATFVKTILDGDKNLENDSMGATQDSNGAVKKAMEENKGAASYLGLSYLNSDDAKASLIGVKIDGVSYEKENITSGKYPFWSWGHMYTKGEPNEQTKDFIDYIQSEDNRKTVEELGFISSTDMKVK
ncbi:phosphate ABC transporter substrate-binding protein, PhoT family [Clostridium sp. DSM 8431]|uniref:phosphate ABC transporter substrate-binding protein n=1 Tax=Clostridium sp. DSM 8431 TaxID=1761781 RepID=UPI0008E7A68E|nr:phosphate ABC transporter substrate-binding protein [Clostridium sp. DSM 8431]SFU54553.1 phosphate ABC transporter substrate-binding protein, PhoT family [Clostridium sp. DSM 8431]